jgi:glycosyltransferase involved in cell wall biosynthesis
MALKVVWFCPLNIYPYADKVKFIDNKLPAILAPWIDNYIKLLKNYNDLEVHIIAQYATLKKDTEFNDGNVKIHLISQKMPFLKRGWPYVFRYFSNYFLLYRKVKKFLKKINPDLIHLHGTEHDLSAVALRFKTPKLITIQGFINEVVKRNNNPYMQRKLKIENKIFKKFKYFGVRATFMENIIKQYNPNAKFFFHNYITEKPKFKKTPEFDAHIVFAARICKDKGIEDLIEALKIVKLSYPQFKFKIIGSINDKYKKHIINLLSRNGLLENTRLIGFLPNINDVHYEVSKSLINVLPTYYDIISGTIIESMFIGVPVIAYDVGAINELNKKRQSLIIVEKGNINMLANEIIRLLQDKDLRETLSTNSKLEMNERFGDVELEIEKLKQIYIDIINKKIDYE